MKYIDLKEVARRLGVHKDTVKTYCQEGLITSIKLKRVFRILETDFDDFVKKRRTLEDKKGKDE